MTDCTRWFRLVLIAGVASAVFSGVAGCGSGNGKGASDAQVAPKHGEWTTEHIARHNRAVGLMAQYDYEKARMIFAELHEEHPADPDLQVNLAIATLNRQQQGDEAAAMELLRDVLVAHPEHVRANYCLGLLKLYQGPPADPLPQFERVSRNAPDDAFAAYLIGRSHENHGNADAALQQYEQALQRDSHLISAHLGRARVLRQLGRAEQAADALEVFEAMKSNPRSKVFEFVYGKMGPNAMVRTIGRPDAGAQPETPDGPVFAPARPLVIDGVEPVRWIGDRDSTTSVTVCDIDGDGRLDIFLAHAVRLDDIVGNAVLLNRSAEGGELHFHLQADHPLAGVDAVHAALWGDWNNDGAVDVYLCRTGANQLWSRDSDGRWANVTAATQTANGDYTTVGGALFDADHDGDLDIFCINANGPNELLNNNRDGTFQPIAGRAGLIGAGDGSRQAVITDLDGDRDADIIVINRSPPNDAFLNERAWSYRPAADLSSLQDATITAMVSADLDADGRVELYGVDAAGDLQRWQRDDLGQWTQSLLAELHSQPDNPSLAVMDANGDGQLDLLSADRNGLRLLDGGDPAGVLWGHDPPVRTCAVLNAWPTAGPGLLVVHDDGRPQLIPPGPGRDGFVGFTFSGREQGESMRSNASGIGAHVKVRVDTRWTVFETFGMSSGPGQSLQPYVVGLGGADRVDFIVLEWSDGVLQSELDLAGADIHHITETQRQLSSCPVVFAWNGEEFAFVSDVLGVGGIGYMVEPGVYARPRPWEKFLMPTDSLAAHDGRYAIKLTEPMEEACYLDAARLAAIDVPPGWSIVVDERMSIAGPQPTGEVLAYRRELLPARAWNERGDDVTGRLRDADFKAATVGELDNRFIGMLRDEHVVTLEFECDLRLAAAEDDQQLVLVVDGWVEYPYSQTMFAAWQASAAYEAPTLEARRADGAWTIVHEQFGYPAGMPRRMALPISLDRLPTGATALRLRTNQEIYWDRIAIAVVEPCAELRRHVLPLDAATLKRCGFPTRTTQAQRRPMYDWSQRAPYWDTRHQSGWYTAFGDVHELVDRTDGALVIIGPGEEVELEFATSEGMARLSPGWTRRFVFETDGWCKDMDLYTNGGETLEPIPGANRRTPAATSMMRGSQSRYRSGSIGN